MNIVLRILWFYLLLSFVSISFGQDKVKVTHIYKKNDVFKLSLYQINNDKLSLYSEQARVGKFSQVMDDAYVIQMVDNKITYSISALNMSNQSDSIWGLTTTGLFRDNGIDKDLRCLVGAETYNDFEYMSGRNCIKLHVAIPEIGFYWIFHILNEEIY